MPATERLYAISDDAASDLEAFDRSVAEAKERCREAVYWLGELTGARDKDGRCFTAILEALDDLVGERRNAIRERDEDANRAIEDAEYEAVR